jgi:hypothetical protein
MMSELLTGAVYYLKSELKV